MVLVSGNQLKSLLNMPFLTISISDYIHPFELLRVLDRDPLYHNDVIKKEALFILANSRNESLCNNKGLDTSAVVSDAWVPLFNNFRL